MAYGKQFDHLKIPLQSINSATNNFAKEYLIGQGGFGKVYKGVIDHSTGQQSKVAFKRLDRVFGQGDPEFWKEIMLLSLYRHENIVSLVGYCDDFGEKILAYEYASKKSLDFYINNKELTWVQRLRICLGAARGLAYLHAPSDTQLRVLHRDIKSSNILLDDNWNAKISDFGLSKFAPVNKDFTYLISNAVGTLGYCDPLYVETGLLTKESDIYSFGVVLFEVLCGRLCIGGNYGDHQSFVGFVRKCYEENKIKEIVFGSIKDEINHHSLQEFTKIAYRCLMRNREERPLMNDILKALESALRCQCSDAGVGSTQTRIYGILNVKVLNGLELDIENPYVMLKRFSYSLTSMKKTAIRYGYKKKGDPYWNEEFTLYVDDPHWSQELQIYVCNSLTYKQKEIHELVGINRLRFTNFTSENPETQEIRLHKVSKFGWENHKEHLQGKIMVKVMYKQCAYYTNFEDVCPLQKAPTGTPRDGGVFVVIILDATNLQSKHHYNPYVSLLFQGKSRKTMAINKAKSPLWLEEFAFYLEQPPTDETLHLEVISTPWMPIIHRKEESMGYVDIKVVDAVKNRRIINKYKLQKGKHGQVRVGLQWRTLSNSH